MYPLETRELAVEAVAAGFSLTEAAELAGCSRTAVVNWAKAAGVAPPPRKKAVYLPFDRKMLCTISPRPDCDVPGLTSLWSMKGTIVRETRFHSLFNSMGTTG